MRPPVSTDARLKLLFVTWDGPQLDYLEALFLPIFVRLRSHGIHFDVLQFRWGDAERIRRASTACAEAGIGYCSARVARTLGPLGPFATAVAGARHVRSAVRRFGSDALMPRSLMPAIAVLAAGGSRLAPMIYDADGLAADERVDVAGEPAAGLTARLLRRIEVAALRASTVAITRTHEAAGILAERAGVAPDLFHIVVNGRDESLFQPGAPEARRAMRDRLGIAQDAPLVAYAGSIGTQYRFDLVRDFCAALAARRPDSRLLVLTGSPDLAVAALGTDPPLKPIVRRVAPSDVAAHLAAADLGLAFRRRSFSTQGIAPLKVAEYLLCGLPVFGTRGVGPTQEAAAAGVFLDEESGAGEAARWFDEEVLPFREDVRARARAAGLARFSLDRAADSYLPALRRLCSGEGREGA